MEEEAPDPKMAEMRRKIMEIEKDTTLSADEKAVRRQQVMNPRFAAKGKAAAEETAAPKPACGAEDTLAIMEDALKCAICFNLCDRPVTAPCQHNFCLGCFTKWVQTSKTSCPKCRANIPQAMRSNPRINAALVSAIRMAKRGERGPSAVAVAAKIANDNRPDEAFTTERAVRAGKANASSGRIFVTIPQDHFGPIPASADPLRNKGVTVGEHWADRLECRQWGAHFPHVAGIAGQSSQGAQSVALSGGYEDDKDMGEWFLYTGSGGRDLSGNKRTSKTQSFGQTFDKSNLALKVSCLKGLPVRVVRSHKEKRSSYAPSETMVRYDGIYRIEKCWQAIGTQKVEMCRYLFVRCDNEPAPWTSDENGDTPRPLPVVDEIKADTVVFECKGQKWWDYDEQTKRWDWTRPPPESQKHERTGEPKKKRVITEQQRLLKEFGCKLCAAVLSAPLSTPCGHTFCKACLEARFVGVADARERAAPTGRAMREVKVAKPCPTCKLDLAEFMKTASVNTDMAAVIGSLQRAAKNAEKAAAEGAEGDEEEEEEEEEEVVVAAAPQAPRQVDDSAQRAQAAALAALYLDFAEFDKVLIDGLLSDQSGDVKEVSAQLRLMRRQQKSVDAKAKRQAAGQPEAGSSKRAKKQ